MEKAVAEKDKDKVVAKTPETSILMQPVGTFETVMNHMAKFLGNPFIILVGVVTTYFLMIKDRKSRGNGDASDEDDHVKAQIREMKSELQILRKKLRRKSNRDSVKRGHQSDEGGRTRSPLPPRRMMYLK